MATSPRAILATPAQLNDLDEGSTVVLRLAATTDSKGQEVLSIKSRNSRRKVQLAALLPTIDAKRLNVVFDIDDERFTPKYRNRKGEKFVQEKKIKFRKPRLIETLQKLHTTMGVRGVNVATGSLTTRKTLREIATDTSVVVPTVFLKADAYGIIDTTNPDKRDRLIHFADNVDFLVMPTRRGMKKRRVAELKELSLACTRVEKEFGGQAIPVFQAHDLSPPKPKVKSKVARKKAPAKIAAPKKPAKKAAAKKAGPAPKKK